MKILVIHNNYQSHSGEEVVMEQEIALLRVRGHTVITYRRSNDEVKQFNALQTATLPARITWAPDAARDVRALIQREQPDIAHIHNTHFMMSPSVIHACAALDVPVVCTLHNFRLICPVATLFRDGRVCEDCLGKPVPYPGVQHACFRGSHTQSAVIAASTTLHRLIGTYNRVDRFITPTEFARQKLIHGGLDPAQITTKPHFLSPDPAPTPTDTPRRYMLFVGRLSPEKGLHTLLRAWQQTPNIPLHIIGEGPLKSHLQENIKKNGLHTVKMLGKRDRNQVYQAMRQAVALVVPSIYYETFGMVALEALAVGTPVIVTGHGATAELVQHAITGWHVPPAAAPALAAAVRHAWENPQNTAKMRAAARQTYLDRYTAEQNYPQLMDIYEQAKTDSVHD